MNIYDPKSETENYVTYVGTLQLLNSNFFNETEQCENQRQETAFSAWTYPHTGSCYFYCRSGRDIKNSHASWVEQGVEADWWKCLRAKGHSLGCLSQGLHLLQLISIFSASRLQHYGCSCDYSEHSLTQYDYKTFMQCTVGEKLLSIIYMNIRFKHAHSTSVQWTYKILNYNTPG